MDMFYKKIFGTGIGYGYRGFPTSYYLAYER